MKTLLRKFFLAKEIKSKEGVLHFQRWRLLWTPWFAVYIHFIHESDKDLHLHSHPWHFLSFVLKGGYVEELPVELGLSTFPKYTTRLIRRFRYSFHKAGEFHRLTLKRTPTVSLFFTFGKGRKWGYLTDEGFVEQSEYRRLKNEGHWTEEVLP